MVSAVGFSKARLVFDIDEVLGSQLNKMDEELARYAIKKGLLIVAKKSHLIFPGVQELLRLLYLREFEISFLSAGAESRNRVFVTQILERTLGKEKSERIAAKIFSREHLKNQNSFSSEEQFHNFGISKDHRKDLSVLDLASLDHVVLIDDDYNNAMPGQERNLLKVPETDASSYFFDEEPVEGIYLTANRIYFLAGLLFEAMEQAEMENRPISDWLFSVQWKRRDDGTYWDQFSKLSVDVRYYRKGLEILQQINPKLEFCTKESYEALCNEPLTDEEQQQFEVFQKNAADPNECLVM
ncbi:MAG: hypothetical protein JSS32_07210 [Verrucomicrobia bacterium]|nr:hypothetical protein [Verrucomicrobiota bacterium]